MVISTHINEFLQVLVQVRQVVPTLLVLGNELLFPLLQLQPLLLQRLALFPLVVDARHHQRVLVVVGMFRVLCEELVDRNQRQELVGVTLTPSAIDFDASEKESYALKPFAGRNLPFQVPLLVVQILELQVPHVHVVSSLGRLGFGVSRPKVGRAV